MHACSYSIKRESISKNWEEFVTTVISSHILLSSKMMKVKHFLEQNVESTGAYFKNQILWDFHDISLMDVPMSAKEHTSFDHSSEKF